MIAHRLYVGTIGEGLFRSLDGGDSFRRACEGMFVECHVRALAVHPKEPATLLLGSELGLFISSDGAESWTKLPAPLDGLQVWSLWIVPPQPNVLIFDDTWVNSGFDWLSFRDQPTRTYRPEEGTLVRDMAHVDEQYNRYVELIAGAEAASAKD